MFCAIVNQKNRKMEIQTVLCCRPKISTKKIEKWKYKMFCAVVRKYQPKKNRKMKIQDVPDVLSASFLPIAK